MRNYQQTIDFLYEKLPMFQRIGAAAYKKDLTNTLRMCEHLDNPHRKFKSIHVAGTNGKGSVCHILASILIESGYKTGLYTSPHLLDFRERIRINGLSVDKANIVDFVKANKNFIEELQPSFFEITVCIAFYFFAKEEVDIAVIETGLGGRLDSTNVILPELSVITNISLDHQYMLGDTIEQIAFEKAGIIKIGIPVVIGEKQDETYRIFENQALENESPLYYTNEALTYEVNDENQDNICFNIFEKDSLKFRDLNTDLGGAYQIKNILTVLKAIEILKTRGFHVKDEYIIRGIRNTKKNTNLLGRWDVIEKQPHLICDIAHNSKALENVKEQLKYYDYDNLRIVFGLSRDKNLASILSTMPSEAIYYFCKPDVPRGLEVENLLELANKYNLRGSPFISVSDAISAAQNDSDKNDLILITGSAFVVAEALEKFKIE